MKRVIAITILSLFLIQCTTTKQLTGTYSNGNNIEFKLSDSTKDFEYFFKSEMGILQYSNGKWRLEKDKLYLSGFSDDDIKTLDVESVIHNNVNTNDTQVGIHYNSNDVGTYIKSVILINDNNAYMIAKDTVFTLAYKVKTIQVKCYLSYTGLPSSPPKIDTLYSSKITVNGGNSENKNIVLNFTVHPYDFARVKLNDTLTVKGNRTLYLNKTKLKKSILN